MLERIREWRERRLRKWGAVYRLLPAAGRGLVAAAVAINLLIGLLPLAFITLTSKVLNDVGTRTGHLSPFSAAADALGLAVAAFVLAQLCSPWQAALGELITRRVDGACVRRLGAAALSDVPLNLMEEQQTANILSNARSGFERVIATPGDAVAGALALVARYAQLVGALVLVAVVLSPAAALLLALVALTVRFGQRGSLGRFGALWGSLDDARHQAAYLRSFGVSGKAAKEFRVLGFLGWYRDRHIADTRVYLDRLWAGRRRILFKPFLLYAAVALLGTLAALLWLGENASHGRMSLLALGVAIQAALIPVRFGVYFPEADVQTQYGLQAYASLRAIEKLVENATAGTRSLPPVPAGPKESIGFEQISFRYAPEAPLVLDGLDLTLRAGRSTAIVGLNGAGKTTLVKLLAGLYTPTGGRILLDGVDLSTYQPRSWQNQLAVIFQDYVRYEFDVATNIALGAPEHLEDAEGLDAAIKRAGAQQLVADLPHGLRTELSRHYKDGTDLSGGQWQRIALARAFFAARHGASVLVLDEPTAQLDVRAEVEFYDRFLELTQGLTTVLISHRFSTLRQADHIAVIDQGRVSEQGSHDELLALGGAYARLFRLQARQFADSDLEGLPR
jgi:ATP-binding cassette subfamily B protein